MYTLDATTWERGTEKRSRLESGELDPETNVLPVQSGIQRNSDDRSLVLVTIVAIFARFSRTGPM